MGMVPPAPIPAGFLLSAGAGLAAFGIALTLVADELVLSPTRTDVVATAHLAMLAFLTMGVLGALHQFAPVVGQRRLRSSRVAVATLGGMIATVTLLPAGFATGHEGMIVTGGLIGASAVSLAAWNLSAPLASRTGGVPVAGLRASVFYLLVTVGFGVLYALNRQAGWFPLLPARVMAHAHIGLLGWLGLTYVAVAEKLWPMFLLSHRPSSRTGGLAVGSLAAGITPLATGLLFGMPSLGVIGGILVAVGLAAHVASLVSSIRHRRRGLELLHGYLLISTVFLAIAVALAAVAAFAAIEAPTRVNLVAAEVAALLAWLGMAVIGHAHKIVPFIAYATLRARGIQGHRSGRPLLFTDLYRPGPAVAALYLGGSGFAALIGGILTSSSPAIVIAGALLTSCAITVTANLGLGPPLAARAHRSEVHQPLPPQPIDLKGHR
jgi:hypothetical protein